MLALLIALAAAHHPGGVSRVSNGTTDILGVPVCEREWRLDTAFGVVMTPFDHVQRGHRRGESVRDVILVTQTPSARLWLPTATFVQVSTPFTAVFTSEEDTFGIGDVSALIGQQVSVGPGVFTVSVGGSAPTGLASNKAGVDVLVLETQGGDLYATSLQTWTQPGLGVWSVSAGLGVSQPVGRWRVRASVDTRIPLGRTDQNVRWGTDVSASTSLTTDAGPLTVGAGLLGWTHTPDVMMPDPTADASGVAVPGNRSHGAAVAPSLSVAPTPKSRCGGSVQLPIWQWVAGSQLAPSYRLAAQCQVSWGKRAQ